MAVRPLLPGEYAVLALLALRPMHGYEMTAFIEEEGLADVCPVEQSTLYTYLRNVEARGLVAWTEERVGNRPPRKRFELMREVRLDLLVKLFFLERTDPAAHARLLRDQVAACERYLAGLDAAAPAGGFQRLVARSKRTAAEATLDWLRGYAAEVEAREANP